LRLRTFGGLWIDRPGPGSDATQRPRTLALLAILATADAAGITRERVMAVLWSEVDEDRARHGLSQALYNIRRDLGTEVVLSTPALRLDPDRISSDVAEFKAATAAKSWATAASLYTSPFLDGFHLADAPEFERWAESQRATLATAGIRAIEILAKTAAEAGELEVAAEDSPTYGYTRINYELGRSLLALRRPAEAIAVAQAALRGGIEGSNLYVTRTVLHELLAQLFDATGRRDSAAVHYAVVERAWRSADSSLRPRYEAAQRWLKSQDSTSK